MNGTAAPLLIGLDETARRLGLSERTIRSLVGRGELPVVRVGRRLLFDPHDLTAWIEAVKTRANAARAAAPATTAREAQRNGTKFDAQKG